MSLDYRIKRIDTMVKSWGLERDHDLIASLPLDKKINDEFLVKIRLYVSKALNFQYENNNELFMEKVNNCLLYTSPSPRDRTRSRMPSSA